MERRFEDRVVLVTGGASGIGLAIAGRFASEGARVVVVDYSRDHLDRADAQLRAAGATDAWMSLCDVSDEAQVRATVEGALARYGRFDVLVNNAGLMQFKPLEQLTGEDWLRVLGVDLLGAFYFTKQAFLHMPRGGAIVNISSVHAVETTPQVAHYAAAKAALVSLTRSTALEGKPRGIRANVVLPGAIDTPMLRENPNIRSGVEKLDERDVGRPEDVAALVAYLASDDARFVQAAGGAHRRRTARTVVTAAPLLPVISAKPGAFDRRTALHPVAFPQRQRTCMDVAGRPSSRERRARTDA